LTQYPRFITINSSIIMEEEAKVETEQQPVVENASNS